MARETVTFVIPTKNVAAFFEPTLASIAWADAVIVVDMHSTDGTHALCARYPNVRVVERDDYIFANVNHGMDLARTDWVVRLDSDEVITPELRDSVLEFLSDPPADVNTVLFRGVHYMFGLPMHHGVGLPELCWRKHMFRTGTARYPCRSEHEDIESKPSVHRLEGVYHHHTNHTVEEVVRKFNYYTDRDVERIPDGALRPTPPLRLMVRVVKLFLLYYVRYKGYRDGILGFHTSVFRGVIYPLMDQAKQWEAWRSRGGGKGDLES
ncbi:MAG: glycosyltransferase family 2 protein [Armatimonadota bacterium]